MDKRNMDTLGMRTKLVWVALPIRVGISAFIIARVAIAAGSNRVFPVVISVCSGSIVALLMLAIIDHSGGLKSIKIRCSTPALRLVVLTKKPLSKITFTQWTTVICTPEFVGLVIIIATFSTRVVQYIGLGSYVSGLAYILTAMFYADTKSALRLSQA